MISISVLVPVRPNSVKLSKFLDGYFSMTRDQKNTELLLMVHHRDKNRFIVENDLRLRVFFEDNIVTRLGQRGHHVYINELAKHAKGDWMFCLAEDCIFLMEGWDNCLRKEISDLRINPSKFFVIMPPFDPPGAVEPMFSRGYYNAVGGRLAAYPNTDSWVNTVIEKTGKIGGNRKISLGGMPMFTFEGYDLSNGMGLGERLEIPIHESEYFEFGPWRSERLEEEMDKEAQKIINFIGVERCLGL